jgi:hypothetical protein
MSVDYYNHWPWVGTTTDWNASMLHYDGYGAPKGLQRHLEFARSVGLPLAVSEWSNNVDHGDSAQFMRACSTSSRPTPGPDRADPLRRAVQRRRRGAALDPLPGDPPAAAAASYRDTW